LKATQKQLFEAEERINKLMGEINEGQDKIKKLTDEV
jgi:peptidoglycan hydrolase CwlO-like protein